MNNNMNAQIALNILIDAANRAQRAGALTLDQAVDVRDAIVFFQKPAPAPKEAEPVVEE